MRRPNVIARQSANPSGLLGRVIARVMSKETEAENRLAVDILDVQPADYILEIGFGHGKTIGLVASRLEGGRVFGIDISELMVRIAARRNRRFSGKVEFRLADAAELPYPDSFFDKAYSVHTVYFWPDPGKPLGEIFRTLKDNGSFVLCFRYDEEALQSFPSSVYKLYTSEQITGLLKNAGFARIRMHEHTIGSKSFFFAVAGKSAA